eukprot:scaffold12327_cov54-Phaeocystis_antarctica.AAC.4
MAPTLPRLLPRLLRLSCFEPRLLPKTSSSEASALVSGLSRRSVMPVTARTTSLPTAHAPGL